MVVLNAHPTRAFFWGGRRGHRPSTRMQTGLIKNMCRSTLRAEAQGCCDSAEAGVPRQAFVAEVLRFTKRNGTFRDSSCAITCRPLQLAACQSLHK